MSSFFEKHCDNAFLESGPEIRIIDMAPMPFPVANAQMVSTLEFMAQSYELKTLEKREIG